MKNAVSRVYALLRLKAADPDGYAREIAFGAPNAATWDDPEDPPELGRHLIAALRQATAASNSTPA